MARYTLTIAFNDIHNDTPLAAELHASIIVGEAEARGFVVEEATFVDHDAVPTERRGLTVDWLEWCETDEANDERVYGA